MRVGVLLSDERFAAVHPIPYSKNYFADSIHTNVTFTSILLSIRIQYVYTYILVLNRLCLSVCLSLPSSLLGHWFEHISVSEGSSISVPLVVHCCHRARSRYPLVVHCCHRARSRYPCLVVHCCHRARSRYPLVVYCCHRARSRYPLVVHCCHRARSRYPLVVHCCQRARSRYP